MQRIFRGASLLKPLIITRSLSVSNVSYKWNHVAYTRNADLGRQVYEAFAVSDIIDTYPDWSASVINDVVNGLANSDIIHSKLPPMSALKLTEDSKDVFAKLGELSIKGDSNTTDDILNEISKHCISIISPTDVSLLIKQQHPKAILKEISNTENRDVFLDIRNINSLYEAIIYHQGEKVCTAKDENQAEAERQVCLLALNTLFSEEFTSYDVDVFPLEDDVQLGSDVNRQRAVSLTKSTEETFGFTIRGGERKVVRNEEFIQLNITTPVFISHIEEDSPAQRCGLKTGDVLLAVNDHCLKETTHKQAVTSLKKFANSQQVKFTVTYAYKEKLKYEAEQKFLEREKERIRTEIDSERMGKWHQAKSKTDPEEYYLEKFEHKKKPYQHNKARKSIRLWDFPYKR